MISGNLYRRFYGDHSRDGTRHFYRWIRDAVTPEMRVLNLGAGPPTKNPTRILRGEVKAVVGADIDPVVLENNELDEARVITGADFPFDREEFDIVFCDYVLEHVEHPKLFFENVARVLKPGGLFFFRTPSRYHYVSLISRMTPYWFHKLVANRVRGLSRETHDPWPTYYRINTGRAISRVAADTGFSEVELKFFEGEPSYLVFNSVAFLVGVAYERAVNRLSCLSSLRANIFGRLRR